MQETTKTLGFVGVAAALVAAAVTSHFVNQPRSSSDFELVGKPFHESFESVEQAKSLQVSAVDSETGALKQFSVEEVDGLWRIPSHSNYPAEAAARLAETSSSVMGLERQTLVGRQKDAYKQFGVVDPLGEDVDDDPEAVGKRIQLRDEDGETLVDLIIGKEAGETAGAEANEFQVNDVAKNYYVRRADEQQTYSVPLKLDLSTRFSDWIDPDLLQLQRENLNSILINNYTIEERGSGPFGQVREMFKKQGDQVNVSRADSTNPWEMGDLDPEKGTLKTDQINKIIDVLDNMTLAGVRPRFKYKGQSLLTPELALATIPELEQNPREKSNAIGELQRELSGKGFNFAGTAEKLELVSEFGELEIGTTDGAVYRLNIGSKVEGDDEAIEIGSPDEGKKPAADEASTEQETEPAEGADADTEIAADPTAEEAIEPDAPNRFLFVRVTFDESYIDGQPVNPEAPVEPVKPEGYTPAEAETPTETKEEGESDADAEKSDNSEQQEGEEKKEADKEDDGDDEKDDEAKEGDMQEKEEADKKEKKQEEKPTRDPAFVAYDEAVKAYETAKVEYEIALSKFEDDTKAFAEKVTEGKALVKKLNERFGDWYYVISAENLKTLRSSRADLVETIKPPVSLNEAKEKNPTGEPPKRPNITIPELEEDSK